MAARRRAWYCKRMIERGRPRRAGSRRSAGGFGDRFAVPDGVISPDGHLRAKPALVGGVASHEWGKSLIRAGPQHDQLGMPLRTDKMIDRLIGAAPCSSVVADSTSVNLFKLLSAASMLQSKRKVILTEAANASNQPLYRRGFDHIAPAGQTTAPCGARSWRRRVSGMRRDPAALMGLAHSVSLTAGAISALTSGSARKNGIGKKCVHREGPPATE
jgi:kynureninase